MTEQQVKHLKGLLDATDARKNSLELDNKIRRAASARAEQRDSNDGDIKPFFGFMSFSVITAVALSLLLTACVFIALSQIVKTDQPSNIASDASMPIDIRFVPDGKANTEGGAGIGMGRVTLDQVIAAPTNSLQARDQILAKMNLPNVQELVNSMKFSMDADRALALQSVQLAMNDIRTLIGQGQLNNARQRYERLRQSCDVCSLPGTLEALVINGELNSDSS